MREVANYLLGVFTWPLNVRRRWSASRAKRRAIFFFFCLFRFLTVLRNNATPSWDRYALIIHLYSRSVSNFHFSILRARCTASHGSQLAGDRGFSDTIPRGFWRMVTRHNWWNNELYTITLYVFILYTRFIFAKHVAITLLYNIIVPPHAFVPAQYWMEEKKNKM